MFRKYLQDRAEDRSMVKRRIDQKARMFGIVNHKIRGRYTLSAGERLAYMRRLRSELKAEIAHDRAERKARRQTEKRSIQK
jgi:hypothetical protein